MGKFLVLKIHVFCRSFFVDLFKNMSSDDSLFFDSDEEEREWETLLGKEHVTALIDWLAARKCLGCLALHECALEKGYGDLQGNLRRKGPRIRGQMQSLHESPTKRFSKLLRDAAAGAVSSALNGEKDEDDAADH